MKNTERTAREKFARLCQALADDIDKLTDEEVLAETLECGEDVDAIASRVSTVISDAVSEIGNKKLTAARAGYSARILQSGTKVLQWPQEKKQELIFKFAQNDNAMQKKLTLAARNGEETEADIDNIIEDLLELGAIDDEGNVT